MSGLDRVFDIRHQVHLGPSDLQQIVAECMFKRLGLQQDVRWSVVGLEQVECIFRWFAEEERKS